MYTKSKSDDTHQPIAYSVAEACRVSSLGKTKIYELIADGKLEARKLGKRTLILADSLEHLIRSEKVEVD